MLKSRLTLAVCAAAVIACAGLSIAQAAAPSASSRNNGPVAQPAVPATVAGMPPTAQVLFAVVNPNGTLARGFGAVTSTAVGSGNYTVRFNENVRACAYEVTQGSAGASGIPLTGEASVVGEAASVNGVWVHLANSAGNPTTAGFHLVIAC